MKHLHTLFFKGLNYFLIYVFLLSPYPMYAQELSANAQRVNPVEIILNDASYSSVNHLYEFFSNFTQAEERIILSYKNSSSKLTHRFSGDRYKLTFEEKIDREGNASSKLINEHFNDFKAVEYTDYLTTAFLPNLQEIVAEIQKANSIEEGATLEDLFESNSEIESTELIKSEHLKSRLRIVSLLDQLRVSFYNCEIRLFPTIKEESVENSGIESSDPGVQQLLKLNYFTHPQHCQRLGNLSNGYWNDLYNPSNNGYLFAHLEEFVNDILMNQQGIMSYKKMIFDELVSARNQLEFEIHEAKKSEKRYQKSEKKRRMEEKLDEYNLLISRFADETKDVSNIGMLKLGFTWSSQFYQIMPIYFIFYVLFKYIGVITNFVFDVIPGLKAMAEKLRGSLNKLAEKNKVFKVFAKNADKGENLSKKMKKKILRKGLFKAAFKILSNIYVQLGLLVAGIAIHEYKKKKFIAANNVAEFVRDTYALIETRLNEIDFSRVGDHQYYLNQSYVFLNSRKYYEEGKIKYKEKKDQAHYWRLNPERDELITEQNIKTHLRDKVSHRYHVESIVEKKFIPRLESFINEKIKRDWDRKYYQERIKQENLRNKKKFNRD